jgi:hypothetical protein
VDRTAERRARFSKRAQRRGAIPHEEQGSDFGELVRMWGFTYWSIAKAKRVLGYAPLYNFPEFFEALKRGIDRTTRTRTSLGGASSETGDLGARLFEIAEGFTARSTSRIVGEGVPGSSTRCAKSPRRPGPPDAGCIGTAVIGSTRKSRSRVIVLEKVHRGGGPS